MNNIYEYLLSKKNPHPFDDKAERQKLVNKLYNEFGRYYGEFERIKENGTFHAVVGSEDELRLYWPPDIVKLAKVEKHHQGNGEIIATWNIDDIIYFFKHDYKRVYYQIKDWFDYL